MVGNSRGSQGRRGLHDQPQLYPAVEVPGAEAASGILVDNVQIVDALGDGVHCKSEGLVRLSYISNNSVEDQVLEQRRFVEGASQGAPGASEALVHPGVEARVAARAVPVVS